MSDSFLSTKHVARRWNLSHRTLERWRCIGTGPQFLKLGGRVVYRSEDVEAFEAGHLRRPATAAQVPPKRLTATPPAARRGTVSGPRE